MIISIFIGPHPVDESLKEIKIDFSGQNEFLLSDSSQYVKRRVCGIRFLSQTQPLWHILPMTQPAKGPYSLSLTISHGAVDAAYLFPILSSAIALCFC